MKLLVSERDPVVLRPYLSTLGQLCGKYTVYLGCCGRKSISVISIKKKKKIKYVTETTKQCPLFFTGSA